MKYYIWSHRHNQWWGPDRGGYTSHLNRAGQYSAEDAADITLTCLPGANIAIDVGIALNRLDAPASKVKAELEVLRRI